MSSVLLRIRQLLIVAAVASGAVGVLGFGGEAVRWMFAASCILLGVSLLVDGIPRLLQRRMGPFLPIMVVYGLVFFGAVYSSGNLSQALAYCAGTTLGTFGAGLLVASLVRLDKLHPEPRSRIAWIAQTAPSYTEGAPGTRRFRLACWRSAFIGATFAAVGIMCAVLLIVQMAEAAAHVV